VPVDHLARDADGSLHGVLPDEAATLALGQRLAACLQPGLKIYLHGDLGAGKTTLVRGLLRGLGYAGRVKSPTFTLVETYNLSSLYLYHFDFYRLRDPGEWRDAGFREAFGGDAICLVEWPERAALPAPDLCIHLAHAGEGRRVRLAGHGARATGCLEHLIR
jgi:tRNA threonylcarbamoyladenosine biosynthesis protein TsaE